MISGRWMTSSFLSWSLGQQANNTCVWIKRMMRLISTNWFLKLTTKVTSAVAGVEVNRCQSRSQTMKNIQPVIGSSNARSAGWQNDAVSALVGAKNQRIGSPLFSSRALISCAIQLFTDRFSVRAITKSAILNCSSVLRILKDLTHHIVTVTLFVTIPIR